MTDTKPSLYDLVVATGDANRAELVTTIGTDASNAFAEVVRKHRAGEITDADLKAVTEYLQSDDHSHKEGRDAIQDLLASDLPDGVKILLRRVLVPTSADAIKVAADGTPEELVTARKEIVTLTGKVEGLENSKDGKDDKSAKVAGVPKKDVKDISTELDAIIAKFPKGAFGRNTAQIDELKAIAAKLAKAAGSTDTKDSKEPTDVATA